MKSPLLSGSVLGALLVIPVRINRSGPYEFMVDPDFLKPFEEEGMVGRIRVQDGGTKTISIVTINTASDKVQRP